MAVSKHTRKGKPRRHTNGKSIGLKLGLVLRSKK